MTVRIRCNQNRLFGCGQLNTFSPSTYVIGVDLVRVSAGGFCSCGLPLALVRNATRAEADAHWTQERDA